MKYLYDEKGGIAGVYLSIKEWEALKDHPITHKILEMTAKEPKKSESLVEDKEIKVNEPATDYYAVESETMDNDEQDIEVPEWQKEEVRGIIKEYKMNPDSFLTEKEFFAALESKYGL